MQSLKKLSFLIFLFTIITYSRNAIAIPSFSREANAPCSMCHTAFPQLNEVGIKFKQNGYRLPGKVGNFSWEKNFPLGGRILVKAGLDSFTSTDKTVKDGTNTKSQLAEVELISGGTLSPNVSYMTSFDSLVGGTQHAFIIFNDLVRDSKLNIKVGKYPNELYYISSGRRLTLTDYKIPVSVENTGLELNGYFPLGFRYAAGIGNDETTKNTNHLTALYGWLTYDIGGHHELGLRISTTKVQDASSKEFNDDRVDLTYHLHPRVPLNLVVGVYTQNNADKVKDRKITSLLVDFDYRFPKNFVLSARDELGVIKKGSKSDTNNNFVINVSYYLEPNVALIAEYSMYTELKGVTTDTTLDDSQEDFHTLQVAVNVGF